MISDIVLQELVDIVIQSIEIKMDMNFSLYDDHEVFARQRFHSHY